VHVYSTSVLYRTVYSAEYEYRVQQEQVYAGGGPPANAAAAGRPQRRRRRRSGPGSEAAHVCDSERLSIHYQERKRPVVPARVAHLSGSSTQHQHGRVRVWNHV
jgi:hypothetical protein